MKIPLATYRLQFNTSFTFRQAQEIIDYLADLGISDIYASPLLQARPGSTHGYDVEDPRVLNADLGSREDFDALIKTVHSRGMGWVQDIVPNHMAFDNRNSMLMDILEHGDQSPYYHFFDIDWQHPYENMRGRLLAPFLGKFYADALKDGEIKLVYDEAGFFIQYYSLRFPVRIDSYLSILCHDIERLETHLGKDNSDLVKLLGAIHFLKSLQAKQPREIRLKEIRYVKKMIFDVYQKNELVRRYMADNIAFFNGQPGQPSTFDHLDRLLSEQLFRLSYWKVATEEINYRRFFTVNDLIGVNVSNEEVFNLMHELIIPLAAAGTFTGLRVDHIDGLYDPRAYLKRLRERLPDVYLTVEKILAVKEELPSDWPLQGTTGYDFLNWVNRIFCDMHNEKYFSVTYRRFTRLDDTYEQLVLEKKLLIIGKHMAGNIDNLAQYIKKISSNDRSGRDITLYGLRRTLVEVMAFFSVYRTYFSPGSAREEDKTYIREAIQKAQDNSPGLAYELAFISDFFLQTDKGLSDDQKRLRLDFVMAFQQQTGPLMAKGFEDTVLYIYNRLISQNEVGSDPRFFGCSIDDFHAFNQQRFASFPYTMNATSTHDTKRGEDVRARINVLSEVPREWAAHVRQWNRMNRTKKIKVKGNYAPDANDEYFLYQTLIGVHPFENIPDNFCPRLKEYIIKAVREAKRHTAWIKPDTEYETACVSFIESILKESEDNAFLKSFLSFKKKIAFYGIFNSLSQALLKITAPGIPDFYQGTELYEFNLVDPDNRRAVDFSVRKKMLNDMRAKESSDTSALLRELLETREDGRIKMFTIYRALKVRQVQAALFEKGAYIPLKTQGTYKDHIIAFARRLEHAWTVTVIPRFLTAVIPEGKDPLGGEVWKDTCVMFSEGAPEKWYNAITGELITAQNSLEIGSIFRQFPVALVTNNNTINHSDP